MNRPITDILQSIGYLVELRATIEDFELQNHLDMAIEALEYCAGVKMERIKSNINKESEGYLK